MGRPLSLGRIAPVILIAGCTSPSQPDTKAIAAEVRAADAAIRRDEKLLDSLRRMGVRQELLGRWEALLAEDKARHDAALEQLILIELERRGR